MIWAFEGKLGLQQRTMTDTIKQNIHQISITDVHSNTGHNEEKIKEL